MTQTQRRTLELTRECLRIEAEIDAALLGELQAEHWEGRSAVGPISTETWFISGVRLEPAGNAVQPGKAARLVGIRMRRKQIEEARLTPIAPQVSGEQPVQPGVTSDLSVAVAEEPFPRAELPEIRLVLDELHDEAVITNGYKPPTLREAGQRGKRLLAERDRHATASRIEQVAREPGYAERRLKRGEHFKR